MALIAVLVASHWAGPSPATAADTVAVAAWDFRHLSKDEAARMADRSRPAQRTWRNTFGAERKTATWRRRGTAALDVDIVALQGIDNIRDVRRVFPAKVFHLVLSRVALRTAPSLPPRGQAPQTSPVFAGIAIRRRAGLRMTGRHQFRVPRLHAPVAQTTPPGLAVRLTIAREPLWIASLMLDRTCRGVSDNTLGRCDGALLVRRDVKTWIERTRRAGTPVVLAGHVDDVVPKKDGPASPSGTANAACPHVRPRVRLLGTDDSKAGGFSLRRRASPAARPCATLVDVIAANAAPSAAVEKRN